MFDTLSERLQAAFQKLRGKGRLSEDDVKEALREIRRALLEADVHYNVVKEFVDRIRERAVGQEILQSLSAAQQVIKIVQDELVLLLGESQAKLARASQAPTVVLMVGLQGAGKTTIAAKLAKHLRDMDHRRPLLVAADVYRPAAIEQLQILGQQIGVPVFTLASSVQPVDIVHAALEEARRAGQDYVIIDTAGRLHIDGPLMQELIAIQGVAKPDEVLLVLDAMTGQDAVSVAEHFHEQLALTGIVLTKLDGDTRGGAALSVRHVTGCPIKFVGTGEKVDALEPFYPDRMASRILGMGDVLTLIEKAQSAFEDQDMVALEAKFRKSEFTLDDFLSQLQQVKRMGPLDQILGMIPGMGKLKKMQPQGVDDKQFRKTEAIILSMSPQERARPDLVGKSSSRRLRISKGSGTQVRDVNQLLKQFDDMKKLMKQFSGMNKHSQGMGQLANSMKGPNPFSGGSNIGRHGKKRR